jgi:hypothetical protein
LADGAKLALLLFSIDCPEITVKAVAAVTLLDRIQILVKNRARKMI